MVNAMSEIAMTPPTTPAAMAIVCPVVIALPVAAFWVLGNPVPFAPVSTEELEACVTPIVGNEVFSTELVNEEESTGCSNNEDVGCTGLSSCPAELDTCASS